MKRLIVAIVVMCSAHAYADVPWAQGVAKDKQTQANALFAEANQLFAQQAHAPALDKYRAAIALWDHPLIQFNMAVTLVRLDRILEAADALDRALRFDAAPFPSREQYQQALDYQKLVAGRVGTIGAECKQQGVAILLDGKPWFTCPGTQSVRVLAGEHVVVAEGKGMMTVSRRSVVVGRGSSMATFQLYPIEDVAKLEYPTPRWVPWTVGGAGVAIGLGGLGLWFAGSAAMDRFDARADMLCDTMGCSADLDQNETERDLARQRDNAQLEGDIGVGLMIAGSAIAVGGVVWVVLNRPRRVLPELEVTPATGGMTARATIRF